MLCKRMRWNGSNINFPGGGGGGGGGNPNDDQSTSCETSSQVTNCEVSCSVTPDGSTKTTDCLITECSETMACNSTGTTTTSRTTVGCASPVQYTPYFGPNDDVGTIGGGGAAGYIAWYGDLTMPSLTSTKDPEPEPMAEPKPTPTPDQPRPDDGVSCRDMTYAFSRSAAEQAIEAMCNASLQPTLDADRSPDDILTYTAPLGDEGSEGAAVAVYFSWTLPDGGSTSCTRHRDLSIHGDACYDWYNRILDAWKYHSNPDSA